jgi:hypothetical protein
VAGLGERRDPRLGIEGDGGLERVLAGVRFRNGLADEADHLVRNLALELAVVGPAARDLCQGPETLFG